MTDSLFQTEVFRQGQDGCHTYRIPALAMATDSTLIALAEGRRDSTADPGGGHIDLFYKLSHDGGRSWSPRRSFDQSHEGWGASNLTVVVQRKTGRIFVVFNRWMPGRGGRTTDRVGRLASRPGTMDNQLWLRFSDDHGNTWSPAADITRQGRDVERWGMAVPGPGTGIETRTGRLIIPMDSPGAFEDLEKTAAFALYSDDGGQSWQRGRHLNAFTTENQLVELDDGRLLIDARQKDAIETRWVALSDDQGASWGEPVPGQTVTQICSAILRYPAATPSSASALIWSGPKGPGRLDLVLRVSADQGCSFPAERLIGPGRAAYSSLALLDDGAVGVLWEGGSQSPYEKIHFTRLEKDAIQALWDEASAPR